MEQKIVVLQYSFSFIIYMAESRTNDDDDDNTGLGGLGDMGASIGKSLGAAGSSLSSAGSSLGAAGAGLGAGLGSGLGSGLGLGSSPPDLKGSGTSFKEFVESNNLVARVAFLLLIIFIFIIILQISIRLLVYFLDKSSSPHLINGMIDARHQIIIPQSPDSLNSKPIGRSENGPNGIEFTWSTWIFINDLPQKMDNTYKHIFHKGNNEFLDNGLNYPNNAPGLYISPGKNELTIVMNTYDKIDEEIVVPNIPLNKWINVIIRCRNTTLDVYINGTIAKSADLNSVPKQNYGDVFIAANGGFDGYISNLWYYNYALGTSAIQTITKVGPNIKMSEGSDIGSKFSKYLSLRWYFYGNEDQFNP
jgi:hypothetical protein